MCRGRVEEREGDGGEGEWRRRSGTSIRGELIKRRLVEERKRGG